MPSWRAFPILFHDIRYAKGELKADPKVPKLRLSVLALSELLGNVSEARRRREMTGTQS